MTTLRSIGTPVSGAGGWGIPTLSVTAALATGETPEQAARILKYVMDGEL